jgi:hypothetical protein
VRGGRQFPGGQLGAQNDALWHCYLHRPHLWQLRELLAQAKAAALACDEKLPAGNSRTAVARAQCQFEAAKISRPTVIFPDLADTFWATRMRVAEEVQGGKLTIAQGNEIISNKNSEVTTEGQRRMAADRAISAQENANRAALFAAYMASLKPSTPPPNHSINCNSMSG